MRISSRLTIIATVLLTLAPLGLSGCDDDETEPSIGEQVTHEYPHLRELVYRSTEASSTHVVAVGQAGENRAVRLALWARDGTVVVDHSFSTVTSPSATAACVGGDSAAALAATPITEEQHTIHLLRIDSGTVTPEPTLLMTMGGAVSLRSVESIETMEETCGLCAFGNDGDLTCQIGLDSPPVSWATGGLRNWSVHRVETGLFLGDWLTNDTGELFARVGQLPAEGGEVVWLHAVNLGTLPEDSRGDASEDPLLGELQPQFLTEENHLAFLFIDGTNYLSRLFVKRFPLAATPVAPAAHVKSCRVVCRVRWFGRVDGETWIWIDNQGSNSARRLGGSDEEPLISFAVLDDVHHAGGGLFKQSVGNQLFNFWYVVGEGASGQGDDAEDGEDNED